MSGEVVLVGRYEHALDAKGRLILPARFRETFGGGAYIAEGLDGCLYVWEPRQFEEMAQRVGTNARRGAQHRLAARRFFAEAAHVVPDKQGRVQIPPRLRELAGLRREVTLVGQGSRVEIWDAQRYRRADEESRRVPPEILEELGVA